MNAIPAFAVLLFVTLTSGVVESRQSLIDPWREGREACRKQYGLTEEDLVRAENDLHQVRAFIKCFGQRLGNFNEDGTVNREGTLKNIAPLTPLAIAVPILDCCVDQVYKGKSPNPYEDDVLITDFVTCWKNSLPLSMWNLIGVLKPPTYPHLDKCHERR